MKTPKFEYSMGKVKIGGDAVRIEEPKEEESKEKEKDNGDKSDKQDG